MCVVLVPAMRVGLVMPVVMAGGGLAGCGCVLFEKCIVDASIFIFAMHIESMFLVCVFCSS